MYCKYMDAQFLAIQIYRVPACGTQTESKAEMLCLLSSCTGAFCVLAWIRGGVRAGGQGMEFHRREAFLPFSGS